MGWRKFVILVALELLICYFLVLPENETQKYKQNLNYVHMVEY